MTIDELHAYLDSKEPLTVEQVKEIIYQLKQDSFNEIVKNTNFDDWRVQWYNGEMNGFQIALDLLGKVRSDDE